MSIAREFDRWASHPETCHAQINGKRCGFVAQRTCPGCDVPLCSTCSHRHECQDADVQVAITRAITEGGDRLIHLVTHGCTSEASDREAAARLQADRAAMLDGLAQRERGYARRGK